MKKTKFMSEVTTTSGVVTTRLVEAEFIRDIQIGTTGYFLVRAENNKLRGLNKRFWKVEKDVENKVLG